MTRLYIGLMSGTSLDGLDIAAVSFTNNGAPHLLSSAHQKLPPRLRERLFQLTRPASDELVEYGHCDREFSLFCAEGIERLLDTSSIRREDVVAIGSHGQTVRHYPTAPLPFTLQLGCPSTLAAETGIDVVANFRQKDIALGGQGAPLAPAFHQSVFSCTDENRAVLNIGGIANLSFLPANGEVSGHDCGPGNCLLDYWYASHHAGTFDARGQWAREGKVISDMLNKMSEDNYFSRLPPKSTGREYFSPTWLEQYIKDGNEHPPRDIQRTLLELTAGIIAQDLAARQASSCYVCGGGIHNDFLMERLRKLSGVPLHSTVELGVHPDWVEAMAFAWLAWCFINRRPGNLPSVTGASRSAVLGALFPAR